MNIPNFLTAIRFLLIPVFGYYLHVMDYYKAIAMFLLAGLTDVLDGFIARKFNMITTWGKLADPIADKLMQITALAFLTLQKKIPPIVLIIVIAKETFMGVGTILLYKQDNVVVSANWYGKMATVVFYLAIIFAVFNKDYSDIFVFIAVIATLFAFFMYSLKFVYIRRKTDDGTKKKVS